MYHFMHNYTHKVLRLLPRLYYRSMEFQLQVAFVPELYCDSIALYHCLILLLLLLHISMLGAESQYGQNWHLFNASIHTT